MIDPNPRISPRTAMTTPFLIRFFDLYTTIAPKIMARIPHRYGYLKREIRPTTNPTIPATVNSFSVEEATGTRAYPGGATGGEACGGEPPTGGTGGGEAG